MRDRSRTRSDGPSWGADPSLHIGFNLGRMGERLDSLEESHDRLASDFASFRDRALKAASLLAIWLAGVASNVMPEQWAALLKAALAALGK